MLINCLKLIHHSFFSFYSLQWHWSLYHRSIVTLAWTNDAIVIEWHLSLSLDVNVTTKQVLIAIYHKYQFVANGMDDIWDIATTCFALSISNRGSWTSFSKLIWVRPWLLMKGIGYLSCLSLMIWIRLIHSTKMRKLFFFSQQHFK